MGKRPWDQRIRELMANLRVEKTELADLVGVDPVTIWRWAKPDAEEPSYLTEQVVDALEEIVRQNAVEEFFKTIRARGVRPKTREMLELIFFYSGGRRLVKR